MINLSDHNPKKNISGYIHELSEDEPDFVNELSTGAPMGSNATDFKAEIQESMNDESKKLVVEVNEEVEIKQIEDIKDYLKLLLVTVPINTFKPSNPSGINVGSSLTDFGDHSQKDLEKQLLEKLKTGEVTKKCEILCKKIRSLTDCNDEVKYQRIIFCSDEKTIKKFRRSKNKNLQKVPRNKKLRHPSRGFSRPSPLTRERLNSHSQRSGSVSSSVIRVGKKDSESGYSGMTFPGQSQITITNSQLKPSRSRARQAINDPIINVKVSDGYAEQFNQGMTAVSFVMPTQTKPKGRKKSANPESYIDDNQDMDYEFPSDDNSQDDDFQPERRTGRTRKFAEPQRQSQRMAKVTLQKKKSVSSQSRFKSLGFGKEDFDYQVQPGMNNKS